MFNISLSFYRWEQTIGAPLNEGMKRIFEKNVVVHLAAEGNDPPVTLATERPHVNIANNNSIILEFRAIVMGDLAFYANI